MMYHIYKSILRDGKQWLFTYNTLKITNMKDCYINNNTNGSFNGIEYLELINNNHNGIYKNFSGIYKESLIDLFPDIKVLILKESYHHSDIKWINNYNFKIWVPNTINTYNLHFVINNSDRIITKNKLPKINNVIEF